MMKTYLKKIIGIVGLLCLVSTFSCVSDYELMVDIDDTNYRGDDVMPSGCNPIENTIIHEGVRIVYDDIFYSNLWPGIANIVQSGKGLKGQDNNTGSQLNIEFNLPLTEGEYMVQDYSISGSIEDDEVVVYGSYPINGTKYRHFAEPGTKVKVTLTSRGKWSASFCETKFTVASWTGWTNNFTTDGNLIQTYP